MITTAAKSTLLGLFWGLTSKPTRGIHSSAEASYSLSAEQRERQQVSREHLLGPRAECLGDRASSQSRGQDPARPQGLPRASLRTWFPSGGNWRFIFNLITEWYHEALTQRRPGRPSGWLLWGRANSHTLTPGEGRNGAKRKPNQSTFLSRVTISRTLPETQIRVWFQRTSWL